MQGYGFIAYMETYMNKVPMHTNVQTGYEWVQYILHGNEWKCRNVFRVSRHVFGELCNISKVVRLEAFLAIILVVLGNGICNKML